MTAQLNAYQPKQARWPLSMLLIIGVAALITGGCESEERVSTAAVLAHTNCKGVPTGLAEVSLAEVASFRGSQLIVPDSSAGEVPVEALSGSAPLPLFVSISRGPQLSRGFELHLADQARVVAPTALKIDVFWSEPDTSKPQPLVTTTPCLVVSVPEGPWTTIEATDQNDEPIGTLTRVPPRPST